MPITQSRVLSILGAAQDYQQAALQIIDFIAQQVDNVQSGKLTAEQAFRLIAIDATPQLILKYPNESEQVLRDELKHFRRHVRENTRKAEKMRINRECDKLGIPRPDRGDGRAGALGVLRDRQRVEAELFAPRPERAPDPRTPGGMWAAEQSKVKRDVTAEDELTFDTEPTAQSATPEYKPGQLSDEARAKVEADTEKLLKQQEAEEAYRALDMADTDD